MNDVFSLKLFTRVARLESFSSAARELGVSQPRASRLIAALEREVGTSLLSRTTRAVMLTEAGLEYLARIEPILDSLDEANQLARGGGELRGTLRLGLPTSAAIREIIPRLPVFAKRHPGLRIDLVMDDQRQNLVRDAVDVAIRFGRLVDSAATTRFIAVNPRLLVASPAYVRQAGAPSSPADLENHAILFGPVGLLADAWTFERNGATETVQLEARLTSTVNEGAIAAAVAGMGIVSSGLWGCRAELLSGALIRLLTDWKIADSSVHAYFPQGKAAKPAARIFVDYLLRDLRDGAGL